MGAEIKEGDVVCIRAIAGQRVGEHDMLVAIDKQHTRVVLMVPNEIVIAATDVSFPEKTPEPIKVGDICVRNIDPRCRTPDWRFHVKTIEKGQASGLAIFSDGEREMVRGMTFPIDELIRRGDA